jgi:hypothetical protein
MEPKGSLPRSQEPSLVPILSQIDPIPTIPSSTNTCDNSEVRLSYERVKFRYVKFYKRLPSPRRPDSCWNYTYSKETLIILLSHPLFHTFLCTAHQNFARRCCNVFTWTAQTSTINYKRNETKSKQREAKQGVCVCLKRGVIDSRHIGHRDNKSPCWSPVTRQWVGH